MMMCKSLPSALKRLFLLTAGVAALAASGAAVGHQPQSGQNMTASTELPAITQRQTSIDRSGQYRQELQACRSGDTHQARETCLEEARNAQASRRAGELELAGEDYKANALARCEPLAGEERAACEARVMGFGNTSGSVADGGLLRWVETVVLPPGSSEVTFTPKTSEPVVIIPTPTQ